MNEIHPSFFSDPFIRPSEPYLPSATPLSPPPSTEKVEPKKETTPPKEETSPQISQNVLDLNNHKIIVYRNNKPTAICMGPNIHIPILNLEIKDSVNEGDFSVNCVSTYPSQAPFSPIADRFEVRFIKDSFILTLTDGCGLHPASRLAPKAAIDGFWKYLAPKLQQDSGSFDVHKIANYLKSAVRAAHFNIYWDALYRSQEGFSSIEGQENPELPGEIEEIKQALAGDMMMQRAVVEKNIETKFYEGYAGATTFMCSMLVKNAEGGAFPFYLLTVNLGDSQCFIFREGSLMEMTSDMRKDVSNVRDPGGKMGLCSATPLKLDDRNLQYSLTPCQSGDLLLYMTDGVLDNLQPGRLGVHPNGHNTPYWIQEKIREASGFSSEELSDLLSVLSFEETTWKEVDTPLANEASAKFVNKFIESLILHSSDAEEANQKIITFCQKITEGHRASEEASDSYFPSYQDPLGKPDHTTCLTYLID